MCDLDQVPTTARARKRKATTHSQETFVCRSATDARRGLYYQLDWEKHREAALTSSDRVDGSAWIVTGAPPASQRPVLRKRKPDPDSDESGDSGDEYRASEVDEGDNEDPGSDEDEPADIQSVSAEGTDEEEVEDIVQTPSKRRKRAKQVTTPRRQRRRKNLVEPTPHSRAALKARKKTKRLTIKPAPQIAYDYLKAFGETLPKDPWLRSLQVLHVGSRPDVLPCREDEFLRILRSVEGLLEEGSGGCVCMFHLGYHRLP